MKKIKVAICGCVGHVERFGGLVNGCAEAEVTAVWDNVPGRGEKVAENLKCRFVPELDRILHDPEIDAITITTPNDLHAQIAVKAANTGKHIFVEKPLAVTKEQAYAVRDAVKAANVKFFMTDPFVNTSNQRIKQMIEKGMIGDLINVHVRMYNLSDIQNVPTESDYAYRKNEMGGGVMSDTGNHPIHVLYYVLGKPSSVQAVFSHYSPGAKAAGVEQYCAVLMEYPSGITGIIEACLTAPGFSNLATYVGTKGVIVDRAVGSKSKEIAYRLIDQEEWTTIPHEELEPETFDHIKFWIRMIADDLNNDCVGDDPRSTHGVSIDDAVAFMEIKEAIYKAAGNSITV